MRTSSSVGEGVTYVTAHQSLELGLLRLLRPADTVSISSVGYWR